MNERQHYEQESPHRGPSMMSLEDVPEERNTWANGLQPRVVSLLSGVKMI